MPRSVARPAVFDKHLPQPDLPAKVCALLNTFATPFKNWLTQLIIHIFGATLPAHFLVQVNNRCDFSDAVAMCESYYHTTGAGAKPTYTVEQLFRAEFVRAYYGACGDEELALLLQTNVVARVFAGFSFFAPVPSDSTLQRFHVWLCENHPTLLFTTVLAFVEEADPEDPATTLHTIDTFVMKSRAAPQEPAVLLMRLCAALITLWQAHVGAELAAHVPPDLDLEALKTSRAARSKAKAERQLQYTVRDAERLIAALTPLLERVSEGLREQVQTRITQIEKVIADETMKTEEGTVVKRTKKGTYRSISAHDMDATFRKHGDEATAELGYNAVIITTQTRIRGVEVETGAVPDGVLMKSVLLFMKLHGLKCPAKLGGDMAFSTGAGRYLADSLTDGVTMLIGKNPPGGGKDPNRYGPDDFRVQRDAEGTPTVCICPQGRESTMHYTSGTGDGHRFRFTAEACAECPLWNDCRGPNGKEDAHRTVFISDYHHYLREAKRFNATAEGQALIKERWFSEQKIAFLVCYNGCRDVRRAGLAAARFQLLQGGAVRNLQMLFARETRRAREARRAELETQLQELLQQQVAA
jgi:hypothetical protein